MKVEKTLIISLALIPSLLSVVARLSHMGWMFIIGLGTVFVFGTMHLFLVTDLLHRFVSMRRLNRNLAWLCILLFPLIFLFQFDFDDGPGTYFGYEFYLGYSNSDFESFAGQIALFSGIVYLITFVVLKYRMRKTHTQ